MFRRTRERFERIERTQEKILEKLQERTEPERPARDSAETFAKLLGSMVTSQADLVGSLGDIAVRSVARRNGIRGGTSNARTAQRDKNGKFLPKEKRRIAAAPRCELCVNPMYPHVTIAMIQEHRRHSEINAPGPHDDRAGVAQDAGYDNGGADGGTDESGDASQTVSGAASNNVH